MAEETLFKQVAKKLSDASGREVKIGRSYTDGIPDFVIDAANEAEATAIASQLATASSKANMGRNALEVRQEGTQVSINPKSFFVKRDGKLVEDENVTRALNDELRNARAKDIEVPPPVDVPPRKAETPVPAKPVAPAETQKKTEPAKPELPKETDPAVGELAKRLENATQKTITINRVEGSYPSFTFETKDKAEMELLKKNITEAAKQARDPVMPLELVEKDGKLTLSSKPFFEQRDGKPALDIALISAFESKLKANVSVAAKDRKPAPSEASGDEGEGETEDKRNPFQKNMFGMLGGLGGLIVALLLGASPLVAILAAVALSALGSSFGDKEGGFMSQLFPGGQKTPQPGEDKGPAKDAGQGQDVKRDKGDGYAPARVDIRMLSDGSLKKEELQALVARAKQSNPKAEQLESQFQLGEREGRVLLTPKARPGNVGPMIYAELNDAGQLINIQVAKENGDLVSVKNAGYRQRPEDIKRILAEADSSKATISKDSSQLDEMQQFLQSQFTPQSTPQVANQPKGQSK